MQRIYATLISLAKKLDKQDAKHTNALTARQFMVIMAVLHSPAGEITMVNIARKLDTTKQNINMLIPVLEKKGYVTRKVYENNKRSVNIKVTDSGVKAMLDYAGTGAEVITGIFKSFTEKEMETLLRLLSKLHCYDGRECADFTNETIKIFESEYSDLMFKILEAYKKQKKADPA